MPTQYPFLPKSAALITTKPHYAAATLTCLSDEYLTEPGVSMPMTVGTSSAVELVLAEQHTDIPLDHHACVTFHTAAFDGMQADFTLALAELCSSASNDYAANHPFSASIHLQPAGESAFFHILPSSTRLTDPFAASCSCELLLQLLPAAESTEASTSSSLPLLADKCIFVLMHDAGMHTFGPEIAATFALPSIGVPLPLASFIGMPYMATVPVFLNVDDIIPDELPQPSDTPPPLLCPATAPAEDAPASTIAVADESCNENAITGPAPRQACTLTAAKLSWRHRYLCVTAVWRFRHLALAAYIYTHHEGVEPFLSLEI